MYLTLTSFLFLLTIPPSLTPCLLLPLIPVQASLPFLSCYQCLSVTEIPKYLRTVTLFIIFIKNL